MPCAPCTTPLVWTRRNKMSKFKHAFGQEAVACRIERESYPPGKDIEKCKKGL